MIERQVLDNIDDKNKDPTHSKYSTHGTLGFLSTFLN